jgi:hypothetical protein
MNDVRNTKNGIYWTEKRGQTGPSGSFRTVCSCCSRISRLEAEIDAEEEIAGLERKREEREIQRKRKSIGLKLNKAKTIGGQGLRQTSRRTFVNEDDRSVGFDRPKIDEGLSNCAEDNQQIPNNIPSHRKEDLQRENINALNQKIVVYVSRKFSWRRFTRVCGRIGKLASFYHSIQNVDKNLWVYTGGKCIAIAKLCLRARNGFNVAASSNGFKKSSKFLSKILENQISSFKT